MKRTWRPTVAGILNIIGGAFNALGFIGILIVMLFMPAAISFGMYGMAEDPYMESLLRSGLLQAVLWTGAFAELVFAVVPIIGGVYALQRRKWGMALAGSIIAIFGSSVLGIAATVLTALGKEEFE